MANQDEILVEQRADGPPQPVFDPLETPTEPLDNQYVTLWMIRWTTQ